MLARNYVWIKFVYNKFRLITLKDGGREQQKFLKNQNNNRKASDAVEK